MLLSRKRGVRKRSGWKWVAYIVDSHWRCLLSFRRIVVLYISPSAQSLEPHASPPGNPSLTSYTVGLSLGENQHINHHAEIGENYDKIET